MSINGEENSTAGFDAGDHQVNQSRGFREAKLSSLVGSIHIHTFSGQRKHARTPNKTKKDSKVNKSRRRAES
jgi:hypothetical protein